MADSDRILIADDEPTVAESTAALLRLRGYACDCAQTADEARQALRQTQYRVFICDIKMPGNLRLELISELDEQTGFLPVILVTGYPSLHTAVDSVNLHVVAYLVKPIDFDELLPLVEQSVEMSRAFGRLRDARERLGQWCSDLEAAQSLLRKPVAKPASHPVAAFATMNLGNVATSLGQLLRFVEAIAEHRPEQEARELVASAQLDTAYNALTEAIGVLEETKSLFKSKKLAQLRRKLQTVVDGWQEVRGGPPR